MSLRVTPKDEKSGHGSTRTDTERELNCYAFSVISVYFRGHIFMLNRFISRGSDGSSLAEAARIGRARTPAVSGMG